MKFNRRQIMLSGVAASAVVPAALRARTNRKKHPETDGGAVLYH
jgi:hypothetical protein